MLKCFSGKRDIGMGGPQGATGRRAAPTLVPGRGWLPCSRSSSACPTAGDAGAEQGPLHGGKGCKGSLCTCISGAFTGSPLNRDCLFLLGLLAASQALLTIRRLRVHQDDRQLDSNVAGRKTTSFNKPAQHRTGWALGTMLHWVLQAAPPLPGSEIPQDAAAVGEKGQKSASAEEGRC